MTKPRITGLGALDRHDIRYVVWRACAEWEPVFVVNRRDLWPWAFRAVRSRLAAGAGPMTFLDWTAVEIRHIRAERRAQVQIT